MSSKTTKRNTTPRATNAIVTRTKSAKQTRKIRAKTKKNEEPQPVIKPQIKSPIPSKSETCRKDTPLKNKVRTLVKLVEQVEYHPDKLKRDLSIKKIMLKPKHNFKVVAATNKRKMAVPQKGIKSPENKSRRNSSSSSSNSPRHEVSMVDMVRIIEETQNLTDEDFMEILTCPSPVWWEDPPDEGYTEDAICRRPESSPPISVSPDNTEDQKDNRPKTSIDKTENIATSPKPLIDFENEIEKFKIQPIKSKNNDRFIKKQQKLENVLGLIKNVKTCEKKLNEIVDNSVETALSTDGEDLSDLSLNDEEVLKNLENMEIPIEKPIEEDETNELKSELILKMEVSETEITIEKESIVPDILPPLTRKPDLKFQNGVKSENSDSISDYYLENGPHTHFRFISDDDISSVAFSDNTDEKIKIVDTSSIEESSSVIFIDNTDMKEFDIKKEQIELSNISSDNEKNNELFPKKAVNDLSEYITVYKIVTNDSEKSDINEVINKNIENPNKNKIESVRGQLNSFFKKCKGNKRLKRSDSPFPANTVTDVKMEKENSDDKTSVVNSENRLNSCEYCLVKIENGTKNFSCEKCEKAPTLKCNLCNFLADTKEVYKNHVSSCKDIARISWKRNYIINQT